MAIFDSFARQIDLSEYLIAEIAVVDQSGAIVHTNRRWEETAKVGRLLPKKPGWNYISECEAAIARGCDVADILAGLRAVLQGDLPFYVAIYACPFNGLYHWFQVLISAFEITGLRLATLMHVDVSATQRDPLTGLPNRAMFDAQLLLALSLAQKTSHQTGIIMFDLNNLKHLNDKYGHDVGDKALRWLAAEIKKKASPDCVATRIGGDEFAVVLPVSDDRLSARRIRNHFETEVAQSGRRNGQYSCPPVSESLFTRRTAPHPAIFLEQPTSRCTRISAARQSPNPLGCRPIVPLSAALKSACGMAPSFCHLVY